MKDKKSVTSFLSGVFVTLMLISLVISAGATDDTIYKAITVRPGIKIYVDDVQLIPRDVTGAEVDVFIYYGTTYVPARALSEALGKTIQYDGATNSVYIGKHAGESPAVMLTDLDYFAGSSSIKTQASDQDSLGNIHVSCITDSFWNRKYVLDAQYTRMTGTLYQRYENRSRPIRDGASIEVFGDGKLLYAKHFPESITGYYPENFDIDLTGVLELEIVQKSGTTAPGDQYTMNVAIGDCGLWT